MFRETADEVKGLQLVGGTKDERLRNGIVSWRLHWLNDRLRANFCTHAHTHTARGSNIIITIIIVIIIIMIIIIIIIMIIIIMIIIIMMIIIMIIIIIIFMIIIIIMIIILW